MSNPVPISALETELQAHTRLPSFRHMGGKARLRRWLVDKFPKVCGTYFEPFVGKGNVYWLVCTEVKCKSYVLSDIDCGFLGALLTAPLELLPESVTREDFSKWRTSNDSLSKLLEPRITFAGKGYRYGYSGSSGTHVGYQGTMYRKVCSRARQLLSGAVLMQKSWEEVLPMAGSGDFIYLDPPYYNTSANYPNIDHRNLVVMLNSTSALWALSGYDNELYTGMLEYKRRYEYTRNSEIKSSNRGKKSDVTEVLWTNYA